MKITRITGVLILIVLENLTPRAFAQEETISFTAPIWYANVPLAGTTITGTLSVDLAGATLTTYTGGTTGYWTLAEPGTFTFSTDGGFSLTQTITAINVADEYANGVSAYYVFDADVGEIGVTPFTRLEIGFSQANNPTIPNMNIPTTLNLNDFTSSQALYYGYDSSGDLVDRINGNINSVDVTVVPEPNTAGLIASGGALVLGLYRRNSSKAVRPV